MEEHKYQLNIDPRILELLGPSLYTNIYYVLAELIANAYDADAQNVYIIETKDRIIVEDDGKGMSYTQGDVNKYLNVAGVSRTSEADAYTESHRRKMGRKGVGKLAALSVSENVLIKTIKNNEKSGFVLTRHPNDQYLQPLPDNEINFAKITSHGTAVEMINPQYNLNKGLDVIKRSLLKIFPYVSNEFTIHIIRGEKEVCVDSYDKEIANQLCACITLGDKSMHIAENFTPSYQLQGLYKRDAHIESIRMVDASCEEREYQLRIEGWIGAYKSTTGRKKDQTDFPDNFISLYANDKLGEFNILPIVGKNKLPEVYVVGQLYVDLFEQSELPDMALSNRQGYKSDDSRYVAVINYVRDVLLPEIVNLRISYAKAKKDSEQREKIKKIAQDEVNFRNSVAEFRKDTALQVAERLSASVGNVDMQNVEQVVQDVLNSNVGKLGIKPKIDRQKKKILISHASSDADIADIVYNMLVFNNVPKEDIIYTSCEDEICRIPQDMPPYEYLRKFFVESVSDQMMFVVFVTSENTKKAWGAMVEIGAAWITQVENKIFNIYDTRSEVHFRPEHPLDDAHLWNVINRDASNNGKLSLANRVQCDDFCSKIEYICELLHYSHKNRSENKLYLAKLIDIE